LDGLGFLNDKPRKSLVNQTYDTDDNPIETVGVQYDTGRGILWLDNYSLTNINQDVKNSGYRSNNMKVANKINISFFVVVAVLTAIAMSIFYIAGKINLQKAIYAHLSTTARSRAHHIETFLKTQKNAATQLSQSIVLEEFLSAGKEDPDYIQRFKEL